jgi:hypothetical protein
VAFLARSGGWVAFLGPARRDVVLLSGGLLSRAGGQLVLFAQPRRQVPLTRQAGCQARVTTRLFSGDYR